VTARPRPATRDGSAPEEDGIRQGGDLSRHHDHVLELRGLRDRSKLSLRLSGSAAGRPPLQSCRAAGPRARAREAQLVLAGADVTAKARSPARYSRPSWLDLAKPAPFLRLLLRASLSSPGAFSGVAEGVSRDVRDVVVGESVDDLPTSSAGDDEVS